MKKMLALAFVALILNSVKTYAQDTTHTLIKLVRPNYLGLYIAPEVQMGQIGGSFTPIGGASAMLLINKKWGLGVTAFESLSPSFSPKSVSPLYLQAQFAGIRLDYTPRPDAAVHVTFPLVVGVGSAQKDSLSAENNRRHDGIKGFNDNRIGGNGLDNERIVAQVGMQLEANLIRYVKLFGGVNYRMSFSNGATTTTTVPSNTLQGVSVNLGLKMGLFDLWIGKKQAAN
jgi:hypothetical protein